MSKPNIMIIVTHVDDSIRVRSSPCLWFWGITHDLDLKSLAIQQLIENIRPMLERSPMPNHHAVLLDKMCCVYWNQRWQRAKVQDVMDLGMVEMRLIDSGKTRSVPLSDIRIVNFDSPEAEQVRNWKELAQKFLLADVVALNGGGGKQNLWSDHAIEYLKKLMEGRWFKAVPQGSFDGHQCLRLYNDNHQLLATNIIQNGLAVATNSYQDALTQNMIEETLPSPLQRFLLEPDLSSYQSPRFQPSFNPASPRDFMASPFSSYVSPPVIQSFAPKKSYLRSQFPSEGRHTVTVVNFNDGLEKFYIQTTKQAEELSKLCRNLFSIHRRPMIVTRVTPGTPCIVFFDQDQLYHRALITKIYPLVNKSLVYFVDVGYEELIPTNSIFELPDELLDTPMLTTRVSLFGAEVLSSLQGANEIFVGLVKSDDSFECEVVTDDRYKQVNLYDKKGRSFLEKILSIYDHPKTVKIPGVTSPIRSKICSVTEILPTLVDAEERLYVKYVEEPGFFFGQLEKLLGNLLKIKEELEAFYSDGNAPLLYADAKSHLNQYGVIQSKEDNKFYRVLVTKEHVNDVDVQFIDIGNRIRVARSSVLAPLEQLEKFRLPGCGIYCRFDGDIKLSVTKWKQLVLEKAIRFKLGNKENDVHSVSLIDDSVFPELAKAITPKPQVRKNSPSSSVPSETNGESRSDEGSKRNGDNGNSTRTSGLRSGHNSYLHPNASSKDSKWRSTVASGQEDPTVPTQAQPSSKDGNWRAGATNGTEIIRAPRGPPPSTNEEIKGPIGFQRAGLAENTQPRPSTIPPVKDVSCKTVSTTQSVPLLVQEPVLEEFCYPAQEPLCCANKPVQIILATDTSSFYLQLTEASDQLRLLEGRLAAIYSDTTKPSIRNPAVGSPCVIQYDVDSNWYRGQITKRDQDMVEVLFVDYGNLQNCPIQSVKATEEQFVRLPPQAYHCVFSGIGKRGPWTADEKKRVEDLVLIELKATFSGDLSDGKHLVRLVDDSGDQKVVINEAFGSPSSSNVSPPEKPYYLLPVPDQSTQVSLAWFYNPRRFFTSPIDVSSYQDDLLELENYYAFISEDELVEDQPRVDLPCVVKFLDDGRYYRSTIVSLDDQFAKVLFVDYGNEQLTPLNALKRILPRFMDFPQLIWQSRLKDVKRSSNLNPEYQKHLDACFVIGDVITATFFPSSIEGVYDIEMSTSTIKDVADYLIQNNVVERVVVSAPVDPIAVQVASSKIGFEPNQFISDIAVVPFVKSPSEFWIHLDPEVVDAFMEKLDVLTTDEQFIKTSELIPTVGTICLAFFTDDDRWYRARIESSNEIEAIVHYVDYGNSSRVTHRDLRSLPSEFASQPPLALKCCLDNLGSSKEFDAAFDELLVKLTVKVKYLEESHGVLRVRLYSTDDEDVVDILNRQCQSQLNTIVEEPETSASSTPVEPCETPLAPAEELPVEPICSQVTTDFAPTTNQVEVQVKQEVNSPSALPETPPQYIPRFTPVEIVENMEVEAYVAYSLSPDQFWLQLEDVDEKLAEMHDYLAEVYAADDDSLKTGDNLVIDDIYGVHHPSYQSWYRGKVKQIFVDTVDVFFLDYGDTHLVSKANLRRLPDCLSDVPAQAIPAKLRNTPWDWSSSAVELFNTTCCDTTQSCRITFGDRVGDFWNVESMFVGDINLPELLLSREPASELAATDTFEMEPASSTLVGCEDTIEETDPPSMLNKLDEFDSKSTSLKDEQSVVDSTEGLPQSITRLTEELEVTLPSVDRSLWNFSDSIPAHEADWTEGQCLSSVACVSHVDSASSVWIHLDPSQLDDLSENIALIDMSPLPILEPQVGRHCLAMFPDDNQWYRAVIDSLDDGHAHVTYVDYGNSSLVDVAFLRALPCQLAQKPGLALKCALTGTDSEMDLMANLSASQCMEVISEEVLTVLFASRTNEHLFVRLLDASGVDLNEKLVKTYSQQPANVPETKAISELMASIHDVNLDDVVMTSPLAVDNSYSEKTEDDGHVPESETVQDIAKISLSHYDELFEKLVQEIGSFEPSPKISPSKHNVLVKQFFKEAQGLNASQEQPASEVSQDHHHHDTMELEEACGLMSKTAEGNQTVDDVFESHPECVGHSSLLGTGSEAIDRTPELDLTAQLDTDVVMQEASEVKSNEEHHSTESSEGEEVFHSPHCVAEAHHEEKLNEFVDGPVAEVGAEIEVETQADLQPEISQALQVDAAAAAANEQVEQAEMDQSESGPLVESRSAEEEMKDLPESSPSPPPEDRDRMSSSPLPEEEQHRAVPAEEENESMEVKIESESMPSFGTKSGEFVYVSYITSPGDFWIQKAINENQIGDIDLQLVEMSTNKELEPVQRPVVDHIYAVMHPEYHFYYRAKLLRIDEETAYAIFVDYGDTQTVQLSDILNLPKVLECIPHMAHHCQLAVHLDHWPEVAIDTMRKICSPETLCTAVFQSRSNDKLEVSSLLVDDVNVIDRVIASLTAPQHDDETVSSRPSNDPSPSTPSAQFESLFPASQLDAQFVLIPVKPELMETSPGCAESQPSRDAFFQTE